MARQLLEVVEHDGMVDKVYLEEDGTYFHDISYKEDESAPKELDGQR